MTLLPLRRLKNGYEPEGLAREYLYINGQWEDHLHMVKRNQALRL